MTTQITVKTVDWEVKVQEAAYSKYTDQNGAIHESSHATETIVPAHSEKSFSIWQGKHIYFEELPLKKETE